MPVALGAQGRKRSRALIKAGLPEQFVRDIPIADLGCLRQQRLQDPPDLPDRTPRKELSENPETLREAPA